MHRIQFQLAFRLFPHMRSWQTVLYGGEKGGKWEEEENEMSQFLAQNDANGYISFCHDSSETMAKNDTAALYKCSCQCTLQARVGDAGGDVSEW